MKPLLSVIIPAYNCEDLLMKESTLYLTNSRITAS